MFSVVGFYFPLLFLPGTSYCTLPLQEYAHVDFTNDDFLLLESFAVLRKYGYA